MEDDKHDEIRKCLAIVMSEAEGDLGQAIIRLDSLKTGTSGHLFHYLTKRSYEKAWILLEGGNPEKGACS